jgi:glycosyltransferase involved in cell wall biosynthesis
MNPVFSIITIVYNGESLIDLTMQSVLNQSFTQYEYIVIDGLSQDNTLELIKNNFDKYPLSIRWISEKDKGLYDAMNKGLKMAKGDFVFFLNAGDCFLSDDVLEKLAALITPTTDVLYGETMLVDDTRKLIGTRSSVTVQKLPQKLTWKSMRWGMVVCHQAFFASRRIAPTYIENNLAADIDWVIKCLKNAHGIVNSNMIISEYLMGGVSKKRHNQSLKDRYEVLKNHFGFFPNLLNHVLIIVRAFWNKIFDKKSY